VVECGLPIALEKFIGAIEWNTAIGQSSASYPAITVAAATHNIIVATVGNLVGGSLMVGAVNWFVYLRGRR
jgi:formate/nitrite transporter FocA (FNT family)